MWNSPAGTSPPPKPSTPRPSAGASPNYGPTYAAVSEGLDAGFQGDAAEQVSKPLVILFAHDLEAMEAKVKAAGGTITRPIFSFPGGRRFHFRDPAGNELGVFSE
jgi:predicted enzyme related to lactoylglutathione lyase